MPEKLISFGYDLSEVVKSTWNPEIVDIGGGNGQMLLEIKATYPQLGYANLILEEFNAAINPDSSIQVIE
jgi:tRNA G46 methylase TrmB